MQQHPQYDDARVARCEDDRVSNVEECQGNGPDPASALVCAKVVCVKLCAVCCCLCDAEKQKEDRLYINMAYFMGEQPPSSIEIVVFFWLLSRF
jgi:hypothetical protein